MTAPPMRRWQNLLALIATLLATAALLPFGARVRVVNVALAFALIIIVLGARLRAHAPRRGEETDPTYERIARIRSAREERRR
jgi:heme A synthase